MRPVARHFAQCGVAGGRRRFEPQAEALREIARRRHDPCVTECDARAARGTQGMQGREMIARTTDRQTVGHGVGLTCVGDAGKAMASSQARQSRVMLLALSACAASNRGMAEVMPSE